MIHGSSMSQKEFLDCPTVKVLSASAKIKIDGNIHSKVFHGLSYKKQARYVFDIEDFVLSHFRGTFGDDCVHQILRLTDNASSEFKSYRIVEELRHRPLNTVMLFKTPKHGKSEIDGLHTAVA